MKITSQVIDRYQVSLRVSEAYRVRLGHLNYYVVFGTKSGVIQDLQRGKMCCTGVKQTLPEPSRNPQVPTNLFLLQLYLWYGTKRGQK